MNWQNFAVLWDQKILFVLIVFIFGIFLNQTALAFTEESEKKEYLDFQKYTGNRLLVFNDTQVDYCVTKNDQNRLFDKIAAEAVKIWQKRIIEVTQNPQVWNMTTHLYPEDESVCDGYINFLSTPDPTAFQIFGVVGFSHPQTPVANVTIYTDNYQKTLRTIAKNDDKFWDTVTIEKFQDIVKNYDHEQLDPDSVKRVTLHEIGHSLSLNHPKTSDANLDNAPGIMGYNMSYHNIDDDEVIKIVKAYPNGFNKIKKSESIRLDSNDKHILTLGEIVNLTIEIPTTKGSLPPVGIEAYIFPEGTSSQKPTNSPIKIIQTDTRNQIVNDSVYIEDLESALIHWDQTKVLSIQFKVVKEFENADLIIIANRNGGFEDQWFLNDVLTVQKALFSDLLLDFDTTTYQYYLKGSNPNREIEKEFAFKIKQETRYNDELRECLTKKNMKKCSDEIKITNFE